MKPAGAVRHRRSPEGVSFREKAKQSNLRIELPLSYPLRGTMRYVPAGNGAAGASNIDEARRVEARER
jgi:hypothetical protein